MSYTDGVVTIRRQTIDDVDAHLAGVDDEEIRWLWLPGHGEQWFAMSADEQRIHTLGVLQRNHDTFGSGPKWCFSVDAAAERYVAYVDCDLANAHVPAGQANISYTCHPSFRGRGYVSRAVRLVFAFLTAETPASEAHFIVDAENAPSLRVAVAVGAVAVERFQNPAGRTMVRHVRRLTA